MLNLSDDQLLRYSRHILLPGMDLDGQITLMQSRILVIGIGGLGNACTPYLAASGVGKLTLVDDDLIELSNLQRQILYTNSDLGQLKSEVAGQRLTALNPNCQIDAIVNRLDEAEMEVLIKQHNLVVDCTDNLETRQQINKICYRNKVPLVSGAAIRFEGQVISFTYQDDAPCYQCLSQQFGEQGLNCAESGVLAPMVGMVGSIQAIEALKLCANIGDPLDGRLLLIDGKSMDIRTFKLKKNPECTVCSA